LPIGGVKEKVLAAHRMGCAPLSFRRTTKRYAGHPGGVQSTVAIKLVETMDDVLEFALERPLQRSRTAVPEVAAKFEPEVEKDQGLTN